MKLKVSKHYLENKLAKLNAWLIKNPNHEQARMKRDSVIYYTQKLVEMEESNLEMIEIWSKN